MAEERKSRKRELPDAADETLEHKKFVSEYDLAILESTFRAHVPKQAQVVRARRSVEKKR
jgi:hypothetical protein